MTSEMQKLAAKLVEQESACSCGSGKKTKVCGCRYTRGTEVEKLSARLKMKCPHCGVKHASEGDGCSQRSEPMRDAVRRDRPQAYYPEPTKVAAVAQLGEVQKLREKMAFWAALGGLAARALPAVGRALPAMGNAIRGAMPAVKNFFGSGIGSNLAQGAAMQAGMNAMAPRPA